VDDPQVDLLTHIEFEQCILEGLDRTGHVALDDQVEHSALALLQTLQQVFQGPPTTPGRQLGVALARLPGVGDLPGDAVLLHHQERVAGVGNGRETEHLHRPRRHGDVDRVTVLIEHRPHAAMGLADDDALAGTQRSALHQHCGHGTAALVQMRLDRHTLRVLLGVRPQVQARVRGQDDRLQ